MPAEAKMSTPRPPFARRILPLLLGLVLTCLVAVVVSALSNLGLPTHSTVVDRLTDVDKARLAEATHLRTSLGAEVWPGWDQPDIPYVVYNEAYAFLVGYDGPEAPPAGWITVPAGAARGAAWEPVPGDTYLGQPYYRQSLAGLDYTPQAFTVLVGSRWVASFMTKEYAQIDFVADLRAQLPPGVRAVVPYRLLWSVIMGESEAYVAALLHESFHAFQGQVAGGRLEQAERVMRLEAAYPWDAAPAEWRAEIDALTAALAASPAETAARVAEFLQARDARRTALGLSPEQIDFERQREWLEGLAKYAELASGQLAAQTPDYAPLPLMGDDPDFRDYANRAKFWDQQMGEVGRVLNQEGEIRFYYTGLAQAALLDRLMPDWKTRAFSDGVWLEDLLWQAVTASN
jgi:hypothetical protein